MKKRTKSRIALAASAVFLLSAAAMVALLLMSRKAAITPPSPNAPEAVEDSGDGIPDLDLAMQEGWSTASEQVRRMGFGAGMGLPNIKKNSDVLSIETEKGQGTKVTMISYIREDKNT